MTGRQMRSWTAMVLAMTLIGLSGCSPMASKPKGIDVMFADNPQIYKENIYYQGIVIGQVTSQTAGRGSVHMVTVRLVPEYRKEAGRHWVFYADNGALKASKISPAGQPLSAGDKVCGFGSKAGLNWFKLKTLLSDRVYKANRMAIELSRRFG